VVVVLTYPVPDRPKHHSGHVQRIVGLGVDSEDQRAGCGGRAGGRERGQLHQDPLLSVLNRETTFCNCCASGIVVGEHVPEGQV